MIELKEWLVMKLKNYVKNGLLPVVVALFIMGCNQGAPKPQPKPPEPQKEIYGVLKETCSVENYKPTVREFNLEAFNWGYRADGNIVDKLGVCEGDLVRINLSVKSHEHVGHDSGKAAHGFGISINDKFLFVQAAEGETKTLEFIASKAGTYLFVCTVYCGEGHGDMRGQLYVHPTN